MTSKIIPFKGNKPENKKRSLDNFSDVKDFLLSSIEDGMFDLSDELVDKFNQLVEAVPDDEVNDFLFAISKKIIASDWINVKDDKKENALAQLLEDHGKFISEQLDARELASKYKIEIILENYALEDFEKNKPKYIDNPHEEKNGKQKPLKNSAKFKDFMVSLFKKLLKQRGLLDGLAIAYADLLEYWNDSDFEILQNNEIKKIDKEKLLATLKKRQIQVWEKEACLESPKYFSLLFKLLEYRHEKGAELDDVCNALVRAVKNTTIDEIDASTCGFLWEDLENAEVQIEFIDRDSSETKNLMVALSEEVYKEKKYNHQIAFWFGIFQTYFYDVDEWTESCHPEFLFTACGGSDYGLSFPDWLFVTGKTFLIRNKPKEALYCFKRSFLDNIFDQELNLSNEDVEAIIRATRLSGEYQDVIKFLAIFPDLLERGVLPDLRFWGTLEEIRIKLEVEYRTLSIQKIDDFYEIVAKEDYPSLLKYLGAPEKNTNEIILTKDQLKCLIEKINEKAAILRSLQEINAKSDAVLRGQNLLYEKNKFILDAIQENEQELLAAIDKKAESIIDNLHNVNKKHLEGKDLSSYEKYYQDYFAKELWGRLETETRKYFLMAKSLYDSHKWSAMDEFGFVAIEYAKAIENEFVEKIIKKYIALNGKIELGENNRPFVVDRNSEITFGSICMILNLAKKSPANDFVKFLKNKTTGGDSILTYKKTLFDIKDKFRNPAAHPSNYSRVKVDEFENLLFADQSLRDFMKQIQPVT
ncbi:MAG TPA: hypothetical protein VJ343_00105 [archaeon]|nr:hypothetical protein [archaeon]